MKRTLTIAIVATAIVTASCSTGWGIESEPVGPTWVEYQACIETGALERLYIQFQDPPPFNRPPRDDLAYFTTLYEAGATKRCAELRPLLTTDQPRIPEADE